MDFIFFHSILCEADSIYTYIDLYIYIYLFIWSLSVVNILFNIFKTWKVRVMRRTGKEIRTSLQGATGGGPERYKNIIPSVRTEMWSKCRYSNS